MIVCGVSVPFAISSYVGLCAGDADGVHGCTMHSSKFLFNLAL